MTASTLRRSMHAFAGLAAAATLGLVAPSHAIAAGSVRQHLEILAHVDKDPALAQLPSIRIDALTATVSVDDRMNADEAFDGPFLKSLKEGLGWYLEQRGFRVVTTGEDLRVVGTVSGYEGWKGWGHWGAHVDLDVKLVDKAGAVQETRVTSEIKYSDDEKVVDDAKPSYKGSGLKPELSPILFTRIVEDLGEKLALAMKDPTSTHAPTADRAPTPPPAATGRGIITIDASVANAEVLIDGKLVGTTPVADVPLPAGSHVIEVQKRGFASWKRDVMVLEGTRSRFVADLVAAAHD